MQSRSERGWKDWSPWRTSAVADTPAQPVSSSWRTDVGWCLAAIMELISLRLEQLKYMVCPDHQTTIPTASISTGGGTHQAKPTHTDPEDDRQADPAMPSGSTSKTWNPARDRGFWTEQDQSQDQQCAHHKQGHHNLGDCNCMLGGDHQALLGHIRG